MTPWHTDISLLDIEWHCFGEAASGDCVHCGGLQSECAAKLVPGLVGGSEGDFGFGVTCQSRHCQKFILLCFAVFCCFILLAVIFALMPCCLTEGAVQQSAALDPTARWLDLQCCPKPHWTVTWYLFSHNHCHWSLSWSMSGLTNVWLTTDNWGLTALQDFRSRARQLREAGCSSRWPDKVVLYGWGTKFEDNADEVALFAIMSFCILSLSLSFCILEVALGRHCHFSSGTWSHWKLEGDKAKRFDLLWWIC